MGLSIDLNEVTFINCVAGVNAAALYISGVAYYMDIKLTNCTFDSMVSKGVKAIYIS
jgi:hypothetical protein